MKTVISIVFGLSLFNVLAQTFQIQVPMIDASLPECDPRRNSLFCDFLDSDTDIIRLENRNETIGKIYIYNIPELHLSQPLCTNLALNSIGRVKIVETQSDVCDHKIEIAARDTQFSRIPENVKEIDLENCYLSSLTLSSALTKVHILNSHIEVLNTTEPLSNATSFKVLGSFIGRLENFVLEGSEFSMKSTQIDLISPRGLEVKQGAIKIENCSLKNVSDDSFIVYPNANLILKNISGNFMISNARKQRGGRLFVVENTEDEKVYSTEFVIVLSALFITAISCIVLIFVQFIKKKKNCYFRQGNDESRITSVYPKIKDNLETDGLSAIENEEKSLLDVSCVTLEDHNTEYLENQGTRSSVISTRDCITTSDGTPKKIDDTLTTAPHNTEYLENQGAITTQSSVISTRDCITTSDGTPKKIDDILTTAPNNTEYLENQGTKTTQCSVISTSDCMATSDGTPPKIEDTLTMAPLKLHACHQSQDKLMDNVIVFHVYTLNERHWNSIAHALEIDIIRIGLKKNTYEWEEVKRELLSINPRLSDFPVIKIFAFELRNIRNGQHISSMNKGVLRTIQEHEKNERKPTATPTHNAESSPSQAARNLIDSTHPEIEPSTKKSFNRGKDITRR